MLTKISDLNRTFLYNISSIKPQKKSHAQPTFSAKQKGINGREYETHTDLFRNEKLTNVFPNFIADHFIHKRLQKVPIICYASSYGHDPFSFAISMMEYIANPNNPKDKKTLLQSSFPIIARDICPEVIEKAKSGYIEMYLYGSIKKAGIDLSKYLDYTKTIPKKGNWIDVPVKPELKNSVDFEVGDLRNDINNKDYFKDPCVLIFKNVWYQLKDKDNKEQRQELAEKLFEKLKPNSLLIVGEVEKGDITSIFNHLSGEPTVKILADKGFIQVKNDELKGYVFLRPAKPKQSF
jgi:chemotaxis methyl-accepting protein methylase